MPTQLDFPPKVSSDSNQSDFKETKMIIAKRIRGRLGNQMFQYAYCKAIKETIGGSLAFSFDIVYSRKEIKKGGIGWENSLRYFNIEDYDTFSGDPRARYGTTLQIFMYRLMNFIRRKLLRNKSCALLFAKIGLFEYNDKCCDFRKDMIYLKKKSFFRKLIICKGYLEFPELFDSIRPILLEEFTPKYPPIECNKELYQIIDNNNAVCVSIRRGDFLSPHIKKNHYICDETYFFQAIEKIKQLICNPVLVFFSDDIEWVKEHIRTDMPSYYESGVDPVWEKLRLMYSCKHFILSNSTFSWWAQYLSRNDNKIVISPDHWFNDTSLNVRHLISSDFITIPCNRLVGNIL